jgi:hypothetical protein
MSPLRAQALLDAWEDGVGGSPTSRALGLLAATSPGVEAGHLAELSLGARDVELLRMRALLFGNGVDAVGHCPACGTALDIGFDLRDLLGSAPERMSVESPPPSGQVIVDGYLATVRAPDSNDILAVIDAEAERVSGDPARSLLDRCVIELTPPGERAAPVPEHIAEALATEIARLDPFALIELDLTCEDCGHSWRSPFDVVSFVWIEIGAWARRLLREVHTLASAYGWREADILAMSPWRRAAYLELVAG